MQTAPKHPTPYLNPEELSEDKRVPVSERPWINAWLTKAMKGRTGHYKLREEIGAHGSRVPFSYFRDSLRYLHSTAGPLNGTDRHLASELAQHEQFYWLAIRDWKHRNGLTRWDRESVTLLKLASQARNKLSAAAHAQVHFQTAIEPEESDLD